jgi:hypothetical protein
MYRLIGNILEWIRTNPPAAWTLLDVIGGIVILTLVTLFMAAEMRKWLGYQPIIPKQSLMILIIAMIQAIAPALVAVGSLYLVLGAYGAQLDPSYHSMAVLVALLALLLPRPPRTLQSQFNSGAIPIALGVLGRWMALLVTLLVIGYVTRFSEHFSRRSMLTWAVLAPAFIVAETLAVREIMRRLGPRA